MSKQRVFRLQLIATPGEEEGALECVLLMELPKEEADPFDFLAFLQSSRDQVTALFEDEITRVSAKYAELLEMSEEQARVELEDMLCTKSGLIIGSGAEERPGIVLAK